MVTGTGITIMAGTAIGLPMAAALAGYLCGRRSRAARDWLVRIATGLELALFIGLEIFICLGGGAGGAAPGDNALTARMEEPVFLAGVCGLGLSFRIGAFQRLYGGIAALAWFLTTLFSKEYFAHYRNRNRYYFFLLVTLGATEGVFLSHDFFTAFLFFEMLSLASYAWVAHDEKKGSLRAADTYLAVAVIGGMVMLMGIFLLYDLAGGRLDFSGLVRFWQEGAQDAGGRVKLWAAGLCLLFGFGAKAGAFPLHIWLPKAHPAAPAPASALLSGILTKTGIFGVLMLTACVFRGNPDWGALIVMVGAATMAVGAVLALFSVDLKRTLACSSVSQIGFILVGIGMAGLLGEEKGLAVRGSFLHMVNHSQLKLTLFLAAGVVFMNTHRLNLNEIRGFGRKKPLLHFAFLMGALGIGGVPLWNGYVSKTLIHESIAEYRELLAGGQAAGVLSPDTVKGVEWAFLISGGLTVAYMLKLYVCLFLEKNRDGAVQEKFDAMAGQYMGRAGAAALGFSAVLLPVMGLLPDRLMGRLADAGQTVWGPGGGSGPAVKWLSPENLSGAAISIGIGVLVYFLVVRTWMMKRREGEGVYVNRWNPHLDLENLFYRPLLLKVLPFLLGIVCRVLDGFADSVVVALRGTVYRDSRLPTELEEGTRLTDLAGGILNRIRDMRDRFMGKEKPQSTDYRHKAALFHEELSEDAVIISRSLSFGLLLFCAGLIVTVVYLLVMA